MPPTTEEIEAREGEIRLKRTRVLVGAYEFMRARYIEIREGTYLEKSLAAATVEDYLRARRVIVGRDNIGGRIQWHKVAGLMASAIVKNRPIQLVQADPDVPATRLSRDNEFLAVLHGLAICAEGKSKGEIEAVLDIPHFHSWFSDFVYLLHEESANCGAFVLAFESLSLSYFRDNLDHTE